MIHMSSLKDLALLALLLLAATSARADCHWAWHCDKSAGCGFVPFCDKPDDTPPPLRGARLPGDGSQAPLAPGAHAGRKPLPGFRPINPPPAGPGLEQPVSGAGKTPCAGPAAGPAPPPPGRK
jgi:hypothetical protein